MRMRTSLEGKRVLVTGGTTGIGRATFIQLVEAGAHVLIFGRDGPSLEEALAYADGARDRAHGMLADVATPAAVDRVFEEVEHRLGGLDILVACAALGADPLDEMSEADWRYVIETNLVGYLACAKRAIDRMKRSGGGHLLFIGSISTDIKAVGESVYAATKGGIKAFAETLRKEVAEMNIKVTVVEPGSVGSDMQPCDVEEQRRAIAREEMLAADEIADGILFALTRSARCDVLNIRMEPRLQKTA